MTESQQRQNHGKQCTYFTNHFIKSSDVFGNKMDNRGYYTTKFKSIILLDEGFDTQVSVLKH